MTKDEALDLVLEIMRNQGDVGVDEWRAAEAAIKQALAQPAPECTRSHPHENMDALCELRTEIARLTNENARLKAQPAPYVASPRVQEPEYWNVIDPAGNIVASDTDAIRGWARIAGSYKPTVEGLLGFHDQGWRVLPKVAPPAAQRQWVGLTDEAIWSEYQTLWPFHPAEEPILAKDIAKFARAIEAKLRSKNT
jgi:hypothetical protein